MKLLQLVRAITEPLVLFHYHEFQGALGVDGYGVYDLLDKLDGVMILCCWAHMRRYLDRALKHDKARAGYGLEQIGMLYSVETIADEEGASYERRKTAGNRT